MLKLFEDSIAKYIDDLHSNNIRIKFIGNLELFSSKLLKNISQAENMTRDNTGLKLNFAMNYGGKWDIVNAINSMLNDIDFASKNKKISEVDFEKHLSLQGDSPDLLIRTAGEQRLSNFMLWQLAYTEIFFLDKLWPDFSKKDLNTIIKKFHKVKRNFGGI